MSFGNSFKKAFSNPIVKGAAVGSSLGGAGAAVGAVGGAISQQAQIARDKKAAAAGVTARDDAARAERNAAADAGYIQAVQGAYQPVLDQLNGVQATQQVNIDPAFRNYQMQLAQQLQNQAMGQGPSLAQMQLQQATDRTLNQSLGAIKAGLGGQNGALAARTASLAASNQLAGLGQQSGMLRLQEQQQAQQALAQLANQGRGQDTTDANSMFTQGLQSTNQKLSIAGQKADTIGASLGGLRDVNQSGLASRREEENARRDLKASDRAASRRREDMILGGVLSAGSTALGSMLGKKKNEE